MSEKKENAVIVYFNKGEYEILKEAKKHSVLAETTLIRVLVKEHIINEYDNKHKIQLNFLLNSKQDRSVFKTRIVRFSKDDYEAISKICESTLLTPSNLIKYFIMPELKRMICENGGNVKK